MLRQRDSRLAFTLVELLVVIAIIAILVGLTVRGTMQVLQSQQVANTETMMRTVNETLEKHWAQVIADAKKEAIPDSVRVLAGGNEERARVIWIKFRLIEAFPITYAEIDNNPLYAGGYIPTNRKYQGTYYKKLAGKKKANSPGTESGACLLMALSISRAGSALTEDGLGQNASDTDGDGLKEVVDSWGQPLAFYRFPTNSTLLQKYNPAPATSAQATKTCDPLDPMGTLLDPTWTNRPTFEALCGNAFMVSASPGVAPAYYTFPTLVSAGRNNRLGLKVDAMGYNLDMSVATPADDDDNIYSFKLRQGATQN